MRTYSERLSVPVAWWLLGGVSTALLGSELWAGFGALAALVTYAVLLLVCGGTLVHWGSASIRVSGGTLRAGRRVLPREAIGEIVPLDERQTRAVRGEHADPAAYMLIRPYLRRAVYIEVTDPRYPAPYWLLGTRRPEELTAVLRAAAAQGGSKLSRHNEPFGT